MLPSLNGTLPESVIPQENNSPLTLYMYTFSLFFLSFLEMYFHEKLNFMKFMYRTLHETAVLL